MLSPLAQASDSEKGSPHWMMGRKLLDENSENVQWLKGGMMWPQVKIGWSPSFMRKLSLYPVTDVWVLSPLFPARTCTRQIIWSSVPCLNSLSFQSAWAIYKHYPGNPPSLPIKEIVWEAIIPSFKVTMAKGLRQTWSWKLNTEILNPLAKVWLFQQ